MDVASVVKLLLLGIPVVLLIHSQFSKHSLRSIPTVGGSSIPVLSYIKSFRWLHHAKEVLQEGYDKYKGATFKMAMPDRWLVVVSGHKLVEEVATLPSDIASFTYASGELVGTRYIFGEEVHRDPFHVAMLKGQLTRNIGGLHEILHAETAMAIEDLIPIEADEWVPVNAFLLTQKAIARITGRLLVGPTLCNDPEYLDLVVNFTRDVGVARFFLSIFPPVLKPLAAKFITNISDRAKRGTKIMGSLIEERLALFDKPDTEDSDRPADMLQWVIEMARPRGYQVPQIVRLVLLLNFASIFTTGTSLTHLLYHLAAEPKYVRMLREEIEPVIQSEGFTKASLAKLRKLDSFMRETARYNGANIEAVSVSRMFYKDYTLSDGTFIPAGNIVVTPVLPTHMDPENYENPRVFDPLRFVKLQEDDPSVAQATTLQYVTTTSDFYSFGHGKSACPGRFFAINEMKDFIVFILLNYDLKFENEGVVPPPVYRGSVIIPNPSATVLFRKRQT
ncbi:cytochrome P450 [Trametopsis cervina]|nr:cytochrome P450 [Trametopsis cervina]